MKKNITICSPQLGISPKSHLGGEVYDFEIIDGICQDGVKCQVVLPKDKPYLKNKNLIVEYLPISKIFPPYIFNILVLPYLIRKYQKGEFDILRIHTPFFLGFAALIFKKIFPNSKICLQFLLREDSRTFMWILKQTMHAYDHFLVPSQYLKSYLEEAFNIESDKITVIYGGLSDKLLPGPKDKELIKKYNLKDKIVLLNVGSFSERKNVLFLLELFKKLKDRNPDIALIFCGAGDKKEELKKRINDYSLKDVWILDPIYGIAKNKIFNLGDIFMFPTQNDGLGLVAVEAMACKKPVIASDNTALPEVVDNNISGLLAKTNDYSDWIKKTEKLIKDANLRKKFGENGLKKVKRVYNWEQVAKIHVKAFEKILVS